MAFNLLCRLGLASLNLFACLYLSVVSTPLVSAQEVSAEISISAELQAINGQEGDNFGTALAVDGNQLAIAAPLANIDGVENSGAVYLFEYDTTTGSWDERATLIPDNGDYDSFRMSVAIDENIMAVGAFYSTEQNFQDGAVYIFGREETNDNWRQLKKLTDVSVGFAGHFGISIALSGELLAVGADAQSTTNGQVTIYERNRGGIDNWGEVTTIYDSVVNDGGILEAFGSAVAINNDMLLVGAERADVSGTAQNDGAAYLFKRSESDPDEWGFVARLIAPGSDLCVGEQTLNDFFSDPAIDGDRRAEAIRCASEDSQSNHDDFGSSVSIDGDTIVIGAPAAEGNDGTTSVGAVYVYKRSVAEPDQWTVVAELRPNSNEALSYFGSSIVVRDQTIWATVAAEMGAVHVFEEESDGSWQSTQLLTAPGFVDDNFAAAIAVDELRIFVGANGVDESRGAAYVFETESVDASLPGDSPTSHQFKPTDELIGEAAVESPQGVFLGAVESQDLGPLPVWIHDVPAPQQPLFANATPIGEYYNVGATETTLLPHGSAFALALPVPTSVDASKLVAASLTSFNSLFSRPNTTELFWWPITGIYDPDNQLYVITLSTLFEQGMTFVLIEHPNAAPGSESPSTEAITIESVETRFEVTCFPFITSGICTPALEQIVADELKIIHADFQKLGFREPMLRSFTAIIDIDTNSNDIRFTRKEIQNVYSSIYLIPSVSHCKSENPLATGGGWYDPVLGALFLCIDIIGNVSFKVLRHEYFHAIQSAYWGLYSLDYLLREKWVSEGMAVSVEHALNLQRNSNWKLHRIDESLAESVWWPTVYEPDYQAQDFFVYLGQSNDKDLSYLIDILEAGGPNSQAVANGIAKAFQSTLQVEYWKWAKNQVMEKEISFDPDGPAGREPPALENPCNVQGNVISAPGWTIGKLKYEISYPSQDSLEFDLGYLTSELVEIKFINEMSVQVRVKAEAKGVAPDPSFKVYLNQPSDIDNAACRENPDGSRILNVPAISDQQLSWKAHVLLSSTRYEGATPITYKITVEPID